MRQSDDHVIRTFVAIELPIDLRAAVRNYIAQLRRQIPAVSASWSREHNLHLTLKFLGDVPRERVSELSEAVAAAAESSANFEMMLSGCGVFPPKGKPNVLWIGIGDPTGSLKRLQENVEAECSARGFPRDKRMYTPHLTIARIRKPEGARRLADAHAASAFSPRSFTALELVVFKSELLPQGSQHTPISRHTFG